MSDKKYVYRVLPESDKIFGCGLISDSGLKLHEEFKVDGIMQQPLIINEKEFPVTILFVEYFERRENPLAKKCQSKIGGPQIWISDVPLPQFAEPKVIDASPWLQQIEKLQALQKTITEEFEESSAYLKKLLENAKETIPK